MEENGKITPTLYIWFLWKDNSYSIYLVIMREAYIFCATTVKL